MASSSPAAMGELDPGGLGELDPDAATGELGPAMGELGPGGLGSSTPAAMGELPASRLAAATAMASSAPTAMGELDPSGLGELDPSGLGELDPGAAPGELGPAMGELDPGRHGGAQPRPAAAPCLAVGGGDGHGELGPGGLGELDLGTDMGELDPRAMGELNPDGLGELAFGGGDGVGRGRVALVVRTQWWALCGDAEGPSEDAYLGSASAPTQNGSWVARKEYEDWLNNRPKTTSGHSDSSSSDGADIHGNYYAYDSDREPAEWKIRC
ncbi:G protein-regulated inducer of neurite outgrowth 1-like [Panicum virgatum]|uniref:G protein-regulated inducer of neurite outgrowth 1-like n=1 Tax=Panicum virgatum TaxID=38727 RepID=UPI0019D53E64|nr:G protein-regulated inducer of neurite outgrowth 1-like [Panicum virgatum]